jgi:hypothetical protein
MPCQSGRLKIGARIERKEHPWASEKIATKIASDHIKEDPNAYVSEAKATLKPIPKVKPAKTRAGRKAQIRDLKAASQEQRRWSKEAENEAKSEGKMAKTATRAGNKVKAQDLKQDSKLAHDFSKFRKKKADNYDLQAARIAAVKGDD